MKTKDSTQPIEEKTAPTPHILMVSAECYPAAKVGGLADVVGSLPRYLNKSGHARVAVIIPGYHNAWLTQQEYREAHRGAFYMGGTHICLLYTSRCV